MRWNGDDGAIVDTPSVVGGYLSPQGRHGGLPVGGTEGERRGGGEVHPNRPEGNAPPGSIPRQSESLRRTTVQLCSSRITAQKAQRARHRSHIAQPSPRPDVRAGCCARTHPAQLDMDLVTRTTGCIPGSPDIPISWTPGTMQCTCTSAGCRRRSAPRRRLPPSPGPHPPPG